ncbi:MAG TPA: tocopherol cyclase family protein [Baekduia sp.]|nr:tocopherol cyclase family protein [Baekduia sp.]
MPLGTLLRAYRATGADPPFGDPRRAHHGVAMEGYFWRLTDPRRGRVVIALCGVNRASDGGHWATVALAAHPGGFLRQAAVPRAGADPAGLGAWAHAGAFDGGPRHVRVDLGEDARLDVELDDVREWGRRTFGGVGAAHAVPGLSQYWHPHVLGGTARGRAVLGDEVVELDGARVYAEKNWGRAGFPDRWWWGQAVGFEDPEVCVAFAGGEVRAGPARLDASALAVRVGDRLVRIGQPLLSPVRAEVRDGHWRLRGRGPRWAVEVEATANPGAAHALPVPVPHERRNVPGAHQHLDGRLRVAVRRRGRLVYRGESALAGLERGDLVAARGDG